MASPANTDVILYLDTTSKLLMVGVSVGEDMVFRFSEPGTSHRYHSAILVPTVEKGLKQAGVNAKDLTALAVNTGPGSFTGIRTGLATVRTMAQFLDLPVYAFNTFDLYAAAHPGRPVSVCIDALQGKAYHGVMVIEPEEVLTLTSPGLIALDNVPVFQPEVMVYISESLKTLPHFDEAPVHVIETKGPFAPDMMQRLIAGHGERFRKPWDQVSALYLQEPNITLRKSHSAR